MMFRKSADHGSRHALRSWLILGTVALLLVFLAFSPGFKALVDQAAGWAESIMDGHPVGGALVFYLFSVISAMLAFASSAVLVPPATQAWGQLITFLLLWGGWITGAAIAFGIGRLARPLLMQTGYQDKLEKYSDFVSRRMNFWAVLLFCLAIPSEVPGYLFGSVHYPLPKFLAAMAIAESAYALGIVVAGERLLVDKPLPFLATLGVLVVVAAAAGWWLRALKRRKASGLSPH